MDMEWWDIKRKPCQEIAKEDCGKSEEQIKRLFVQDVYKIQTIAEERHLHYRYANTWLPHSHQRKQEEPFEGEVGNKTGTFYRHCIFQLGTEGWKVANAQNSHRQCRTVLPEWWKVSEACIHVIFLHNVIMYQIQCCPKIMLLFVTTVYSTLICEIYYGKPTMQYGVTLFYEHLYK